MLKEIILIFITTFGFIKSDVKLLDLPKESKNFGASIKDFYKNDNKGSYTYIFENENGHKHRQDGVYGEKRGYYTFKAPLPDGRTFTVCYYTRNGYHAKTTIIEVADVEAFCDMIIEQSGNYKIQQLQTSNTLSTKNENLLQKTENNSKIKSKTNDAKRLLTTNRPNSSKSFDLSTPFRIQTTYSKNQNFGQVNNKLTQSSSLKSVQTSEPKKIIEVKSTIRLDKQMSEANNQQLDKPKKTKIPFIIREELNESEFDSSKNIIESSPLSADFEAPSTTESSFDIPLPLSLDVNISENDLNIKLEPSIESDSDNAVLSPLDIDSAPPPNAPQFEIPTPIFKKINSSSAGLNTSCTDLNRENENPDINVRFSDCEINELPTSNPKIDALIAETFKYSLKKPSEESIANATEVIPPSRLFLPPYIDDDDSDLFRPSLDLIPPVPNNIILTTNLPIDSTFITSTERPTFKRTPPVTQTPNKAPKSTTAKTTIITKRTTVTPVTRNVGLKTTNRAIFSTTQRTTSLKPIASRFAAISQRTTNPRFTTATFKTTIPNVTTTTLRTTTPRFATKRTTPSRITITTTNPRFTTTSKKNISSRLTTATQRSTSSKFTTISRTPTTRFTTTSPRTTNSKFTISPKSPTTSSKFLTSTSSTTTKNNNIQKPSLDILPPFKALSLEVLPPGIENESILFDVRILNDNTHNSSNIVSRSISSTYKTHEECKHGILRTDPIGISEYISPSTFEELEAIQNVIKIYGCQSISKLHRGQKLQSYKYRLEIEPELKNCRLDIVKLDNNKQVLYLDPQTFDEFNALKNLNRIFGCYQN